MSISRRGLLGSVALAAGLALGLAGCAGSDTLAGSGSGSSSTAASSGSAASKSLTVGSANFPENVTLAYIYGGALADKGYDVTYKVNIGARDAYLAALKNGEINLVPEYAGSLLSYLDKTANAKSGADVKAGIDAKVGSLNAVAYDLAEAADSDSLNVTKSYAAKHGLSSIADLSKIDSLTLAANPEFATRPDGLKGLKSVYGLDNIKFKAISDGGGPKTLSALTSDAVQVAD